MVKNWKVIEMYLAIVTIIIEIIMETIVMFIIKIIINNNISK